MTAPYRITLKLYGTGGQKVRHVDVDLTFCETDTDAEAVFQRLVDAVDGEKKDG